MYLPIWSQRSSEKKSSLIRPRKWNSLSPRKLAVVAQEPRKSSAKRFLVALRDDWKPAIEIKKLTRQKKKIAAEDAEQRKQMPPDEAAKVLRNFRTSFGVIDPHISRGSFSRSHAKE